MPRVSILIPTYARPDDLRGCIEAALASDYQDLEVLVGDDGNRGAQVCRDIRDDRVHYIANRARLGMAQNWNSLLDRARGDLCSLCMDDDRIAPGYVSACVGAFDADPQLGVVFTNHIFTDTRGTERVRDTLVVPGRHDSFAYELMVKRPVAISAAMIQRDAWREVRPLPDTAAADMVLFGRLAQRGWPFFYIDQALMTYRIHPGMFSQTPAFRTDAIVAWSSLSFSDPSAEAHRRRVLGEAFLSRANLRLQEGATAGALADLDRAREFGVLGRGHRLAAAYLASKTPVTIVAGVARLRRRLRRLSG